MVNLGMNEYLSKEFMEKILDAHLEDSRGAEHYAYDVVKRELMAAPGADVVEVKHSRWYLADDGDGVVCDECGTDFCVLLNEVMRFKYCPNCGAYMREMYDE
jgi:hypothetical protein